MAFIPLPLGIKVVPQFTYNGKLVVNVFYLTKVLGSVSVDLALAGQIFYDWWSTNLASSAPNTMTLDLVTATDVRVENGQQEVYVGAGPVAGTNSSPALPNQASLVVSMRTLNTGRSFRGRSYYVGLTEGVVAGNFVTGSFPTDLLAGYELLLAAWQADGYTPVVASFQHNNAPRVTGVATPINGMQINTRVDTQRRRLPV